jgi:predicted lipoprotein with Yx(FWY)xxD motif
MKGKGLLTGFLITLLGISLAAVLPAVANPARAAGAGPATSASIAVRSSTYGRILFDGRGYVLYAFTKDPAGRSVCSGNCAKAWPPFIVKFRPRARSGAKASLIGTTRRSDGRLQATYKGRPLYYYVGDNAPGVIRCQNVFEYGGTWLVVRPNGSLVR